jgi:lactam utilization protein B
VAARAVSVVTAGQVVLLDGETVPVSADNFCVYSATPGIDRLGPAVRAVLEGADRAISAA